MTISLKAVASPCWLRAMSSGSSGIGPDSFAALPRPDSAWGGLDGGGSGLFIHCILWREWSQDASPGKALPLPLPLLLPLEGVTKEEEKEEEEREEAGTLLTRPGSLNHTTQHQAPTTGPVKLTRPLRRSCSGPSDG